MVMVGGVPVPVPPPPVPAGPTRPDQAGDDKVGDRSAQARHQVVTGPGRVAAVAAAG